MSAALTQQDIHRANVLEQLGGLTSILARPGVYEVVINRPCEVGVETADGWEWLSMPELTLDRLRSLASVIGSYSAQSISRQRPLLSANLPGLERIQVVLPPAVPEGTVSITIRKPSDRTFSLEELDAYGLFSETDVGAAAGDDELALLLRERQFVSFLRAAVVGRRNIVISGATGSGKTTLSKALVAEIPPAERVVVIEDTPELTLKGTNAVFLKYSKDGQGAAQVGPQELLESSLRMRPDRILLQELRGKEAFYFLRAVNAGHPGSVTTVHADSCARAIVQLTLLVKQSEAGGQLERTDIRDLLADAVDVVIQAKRVNGKFRVTEIKFGHEAAGLN